MNAGAKQSQEFFVWECHDAKLETPAFRNNLRNPDNGGRSDDSNLRDRRDGSK